MTRNTFAKGLKKYKFETMEDELQHAWSSPYRYWWSFLSCSKDYWWVCQQNGQTQDPRLQATYESFGDLHLQGFSHWWIYGARDNFIENTNPLSVELINNLESLTEDQITEYPWMIVRVPLNLGQEKLVEDFTEILRSHPKRVHHRDQTSNYPLLKYKKLREEFLLRSCDLWHAVWRAGGISTGPKRKGDSDSTYEIGVRFGVNAKHVIDAADKPAVEAKKRTAMKVAVSRMLSQANSLIENVEIGRFPSTDPVNKLPRWTAKQQKELDAALQRGEWQPLQMSESDWLIEFAAVHEQYGGRRLEE